MLLNGAKKGPLATVAIVNSLALEIPTVLLSVWFSWPADPAAEALNASTLGRVGLR